MLQKVLDYLLNPDLLFFLSEYTEFVFHLNSLTKLLHRKNLTIQEININIKNSIDTINSIFIYEHIETFCGFRSRMFLDEFIKTNAFNKIELNTSN